MSVQTISIELSEVQSSWLSDASQINCRISSKSTIQVIKYKKALQFELPSPSSSDQVHILIQEDNIVLGSLTVTLEWMFGSSLKEDLSDWINIEVPLESIMLITKKPASEITSKSLKLLLTGKVLKSDLQTSQLKSPAKSPRSFHIKVEDIEEEKIAFHRKFPSEVDSLEQEPQNKPNLARAKSPQPQSPLKSPALSPRQGSKSPSPEKWKGKKNKSKEKKNVKNLKKGLEDKKGLQIKSPRSLEVPSAENPLKSPVTFEPSSQKSPRSPCKSPKEEDLKSHSKDLEAIKNRPLSPISFDPCPVSSHLKQSPNLESLPQLPTRVQVEDDKRDDISLGSSVLSSDNEKEEPFEPPEARPRPNRMHLTADSVTSSCNYYNNIGKTEWHLNTMMGILAKLKEDMGGAFLKLIEESTRRDSLSPTRSPSRKIGASGLRTPLVSQRSLNASVLSAFRVEEENIVEVQGNVDVFLDRLSIKNVDILATCCCGLLAKNTSALAQFNEIEPNKVAINQQDKSKNMIIDSIKATSTEFSQEQENYDTLIKRVRSDITNTSQNLEAIRKKTQLLNHDRSNYEKTLKKLQSDKKDITKKFSGNVNFDEIKQMRKAVEQLDKSRVEIEEKLSSLVSSHKNLFETSAALQSKFIEEKSSMLGDIKLLCSSLENIERENHKIRSEMQGHAGFIYVDDELHRMLLSYQTGSRSHFSNLDSIRTQLTLLRSQKEDLASEALSLQQKIEAETKRVKNSQASWNREIESNSETISKFREEFKKIRGEFHHIEEAFNKKQNVEASFENIYSRTKHNQETKDQLMNEISYFSDFVFSLSQTFLQQKRIFEKVKNIVMEKEMEVEAMRTAVFELKNSNPVYFPVLDDPIDLAVADYFNSRDEVLIVPFVRESYGVYVYGSKKIMVSIERGKVIVKVGGGFLPIEVFLESYTGTELDKFDNRVIDASPHMKKFMAKWVGGLNPKAETPEKIKEHLLKALESHRFTQAYAVRDIKPQPVVKKQEDFLTPPRAETPIIEEDI
jgi:predicted  nucleic acid-binding Zn-ribbon protein